MFQLLPSDLLGVPKWPITGLFVTSNQGIKLGQLEKPGIWLYFIHLVPTGTKQGPQKGQK